jgi:hypothetical protein
LAAILAAILNASKYGNGSLSWHLPLTVFFTVNA